MSDKTTKTKLTWCLVATLIGIGAIMLTACVFHKCPVCQWNTLAWLAAVVIVAIFVICGIYGKNNGNA
jgi:thiamine monophosphate synthase